jgi:hypothetical protein
VFRAADGTPLARLSRGPHGGSFELFDDRAEDRVAPTTAQHGREPYVLDDDPFDDDQRKTGDKPGPGF